MKNWNLGFFLTFFLLVCTISCKKENGCYVEQGPTETDVINLPDFHTIDNSIKASFVLSSGSQQEVKLTGNRNILNLIDKESYVENGIWYLGFGSCVGEYEPILIDLTLPDYVAFTNNGIGDVSSQTPIETSTNFSIYIGGTGDLNLSLNDLDMVNVNLSGTGNINLSGSANRETISVTGNGVVDCFNLICDSSDVFIQGNGNCLVNVQDYLNVEINGNGIVYYKGYPTIVQSINGLGSIVDAN